METNDYVSIIKNMLEFSNMVECVYPDQYKFVCHLHNIQEREAMDMYGDLRKIASGQYWSIKDKKDEYLYSMIKMALEASKIQVFNSLIEDTAAIGEDRKPNILAFFKRGVERFSQEFNLQWQVAYLDIAEMIKNGYTLTATARQVDNVDDEDYVTYDGSIFFNVSEAQVAEYFNEYRHTAAGLKSWLAFEVGIGYFACLPENNEFRQMYEGEAVAGFKKFKK